MNDERNMPIQIAGRDFGPMAVLAEMIAVIRPEYDNGILRLAGLFEGFEQTPDIGVNVTCGRVVAMTQPGAPVSW